MFLQHLWKYSAWNLVQTLFLLTCKSSKLEIAKKWLSETHKLCKRSQIVDTVVELFAVFNNLGNLSELKKPVVWNYNERVT